MPEAALFTQINALLRAAVSGQVALVSTQADRVVSAKARAYRAPSSIWLSYAKFTLECCLSLAHAAGLSEAMLRGGSWQLGEKGTHYIKTIKNSSHHLANIINDILDAAAFSKGRLVIKREKAGPPL